MKRKTGVWEWSGSTLNFVIGCSHNCKYCYAKAMSSRMDRKSPDDWENEEIQQEAIGKNYGLRGEKKQPIMFPTSHDITPHNIEGFTTILRKVLDAGNHVLIVSKPHLDCIQRICDEFKDHQDKILFRFTIGTVDGKVLEFWEPGAPTFKERWECLRLAFSLGYATSISAEPILDMHGIHDVIHLTRPYVTDKIWLGKMNKVRQRLSHNKADEETKQQGEELIQSQNDEAIKDLYQKYKDDPIIEWKDSIKEVMGL